MYLLALRLAELRGTLDARADRRARRRAQAAARTASTSCIDALDEPSSAAAERHADVDFFLYLGRHVGRAVALEGALKLKEISYIATDAYAGGEMKHGPIALLDESHAGRLRRDRHRRSSTR